MATSRTGAGWLQGLGGALAAPPLGDPQALLTRHVLCESGPPGQWQDTGPASCLHTIGACRVQAGQGHWLARCLSMGAGGPSPQPCEERTCTPLTAEGRAGQEGPLGAQRAGRGLQARGGLLSGGPRGARAVLRSPRSFTPPSVRRRAHGSPRAQPPVRPTRCPLGCARAALLPRSPGTPAAPLGVSAPPRQPGAGWGRAHAVAPSTALPGSGARLLGACGQPSPESYWLELLLTSQVVSPQPPPHTQA